MAYSTGIELTTITIQIFNINFSKNNFRTIIGKNTTTSW